MGILELHLLWKFPVFYFLSRDLHVHDEKFRNGFCDRDTGAELRE